MPTAGMPPRAAWAAAWRRSVAGAVGSCGRRSRLADRILSSTRGPRLSLPRQVSLDSLYRVSCRRASRPCRQHQVRHSAGWLYDVHGTTILTDASGGMISSRSGWRMVRS
jgi:hypothetical protein